MTIELFLALFFPDHSFHQDSFVESQTPQVVIEEAYIPENTEYCQTVYWYPNAQELMDEAGCNFENTEREIRKAKRG
jgi:hypothetical protein